MDKNTKQQLADRLMAQRSYEEYRRYLRNLRDMRSVILGRELLEYWLDSPDKFYGEDKTVAQYDRLRVAWHNAEINRRRNWQTPAGNWVDPTTPGWSGGP